MKIKAISFAVLSSLVLTACGGGGGSDSYTGGNGNNDNTTPDTSANQQWSAIDIDEAYSGVNSGSLGYEQTSLTLKDGKYYYKHTNTLDTDDDVYQTFFITADGVYEDGAIDAQYGTLIGTATIAANTWTLVPHSKIGSTDLKFYHTYKTIDISGQSFNQVINPLDMWAIKYNIKDSYPVSDTVFKFYTANANTTFPSGSTCLQLIKEESNQEYIELDTDSKNNAYVTNMWNDLAIAGSGAERKLFKDTTAYISTQDTDEDDNADTYAKYQNNYFSGNYYSKGVEYDFADLIKKLSDSFGSLTGQDKVIANEYVNAVKNSCMFYNDKAAQTIHTRISNFK